MVTGRKQIDPKVCICYDNYDLMADYIGTVGFTDLWYLPMENK